MSRRKDRPSTERLDPLTMGLPIQRDIVESMLAAYRDGRVGWSRRDHGETATGQPTDWYDRKAVAFSLFGLMRRTLKKADLLNSDIERAVDWRLRAATQFRGLTTWSIEPGRNITEVLDLLAAVIRGINDDITEANRIPPPPTLDLTEQGRKGSPWRRTKKTSGKKH